MVSVILFFRADAILSTPVKTNSITCGSDSFVIQDGVCDEASNIDQCFFDGGDCCKENKDKMLCVECACILDSYDEQLEKALKIQQVKPVEDPEKLATEIKSWSVEVGEVFSVQVCAVLCLEHELANEFNTWQYLVDEEICKCGWVHSASCPETMVIEDWTFDNAMTLSAGQTMPDVQSFVLLSKTVSCGRNYDRFFSKLMIQLLPSTDCLMAGFLIVSEQSENAMVDFGFVDPSLPSLWHCLEQCRLYADCVWVSWKNVDKSEVSEDSGNIILR